MSGGPQVFLGATTFCVTCRQISGCREEHLLVPVCLVCPWAAARPLAVRAASFARRVVSKPGRALPPPTGPAARHRRPRGGLQSGDLWPCRRYDVAPHRNESVRGLCCWYSRGSVFHRY